MIDNNEYKIFDFAADLFYYKKKNKYKIAKMKMIYVMNVITLENIKKDI